MRRKPDGIRNPDGSWFEGPSPDELPPAPSEPAVASPSPTPASPNSVHEFLRMIASRGGQARAARHSRAELAAWGRVRHKSKPTR
jgi:hypothetical protein